VALILAYLAARRLPARRYFDIITPSLMIGLAFGRMGCLLNGCCYGGRCRADWPLAMRFPYASKPVLKLDGESNAFGGASVSPVFAHQAAVGGKGGGLGPDALPGWLIVGPAEGAGGGVVLKSPADLTDAQAERAAALRSLPVQPAQALGIVNALLLAGILLCFHRLRRREGQVFPVMLLLYPITRIVLESIRGDNPHDLLAGRLTHNQWVSLGLVAAGGAMLLLLRRLPPAAGPTWGRRLALAQTRDRTGQTKRKGKQR